MHVLFVDDEREFLDLMQNRLEKRGISATVADSGAMAVSLVAEQPFDVVVLDMKMPGMDGLETLREIKRQKPDLPVLLLSGHASPEAALSGMENGAADYVLKPVALNDLIHRLREIIAKKM